MCVTDELGRQLRERLDALGPAPRAELLHVLLLPTNGSWCGRTSSDVSPTGSAGLLSLFDESYPAQLTRQCGAEQ